MRRLSFIITIAGLFILLLMLYLQTPIHLDSPKNLSSNQLVQISGQVIKENTYGKIKILTLDNKIILSCPCTQTYLNSHITALGVYDSYFQNIKVLKISTKQNDRIK